MNITHSDRAGGDKEWDREVGIVVWDKSIGYYVSELARILCPATSAANISGLRALSLIVIPTYDHVQIEMGKWYRSSSAVQIEKIREHFAAYILLTGLAFTLVSFCRNASKVGTLQERVPYSEGTF